MGIISKILDVLKSISFGAKYFEIGTSLRESYLINGMLTSAEIWYGMQNSEEQELEKVDKILLRRILEHQTLFALKVFILNWDLFLSI